MPSGRGSRTWLQSVMVVSYRGQRVRRAGKARRYGSLGAGVGALLRDLMMHVADLLAASGWIMFLPHA